MQKKSNKKTVKFDLCANFFHKLDNNGSSTWSIDSRKISVIYYYNDEINNSDEMLEKLNSFVINLNIQKSCWKKPFTMRFSRPEGGNHNFSAEVEFLTAI